jgi:hypothetical protein
VYLSGKRASPPASEPPPIVQPSPPAPTLVEPAVRHPLSGEGQAADLPSLGASDVAVKTALATLWAYGRLELFRLDNFIRRVVATVDNLPRRELAERLRPVAPARGQFQTTGKTGDLAVSPRNAARYSAYVTLAKTVDAGQLITLYVHFYPLFQQAYEELGYPNAYFNDRLIEVIDHLIAAPELAEPARLVQPKVVYQFADEDLEKRSAGEKILMRIGSENAAVVKAKLREIRSEIVKKTRSH